jgi:hypothetical protein
VILGCVVNGKFLEKYFAINAPVSFHAKRAMKSFVLKVFCMDRLKA